MSYGDRLKRATAMAAQLPTGCTAGDRVLIYIAAFFRCQLAGMVTVPAHPLRNAKHLDRLATILADAGAAAILAPVGVSSRTSPSQSVHPETRLQVSTPSAKNFSPTLEKRDAAKYPCAVGG